MLHKAMQETLLSNSAFDLFEESKGNPRSFKPIETTEYQVAQKAYTLLCQSKEITKLSQKFRPRFSPRFHYFNSAAILLHINYVS